MLRTSTQELLVRMLVLKKATDRMMAKSKLAAAENLRNVARYNRTLADLAKSLVTNKTLRRALPSPLAPHLSPLNQDALQLLGQSLSRHVQSTFDRADRRVEVVAHLAQRLPLDVEGHQRISVETAQTREARVNLRAALAGQHVFQWGLTAGARCLAACPT